MTVLRAYRELLRNGNLTRLLVGEFVSSIGDWLYLVAILILVYQVTEDPFVLGIVGAARVLPYVFLSVPAGIVADRFDRRLVLLGTDVARGVLMLAMAALVAVDASVWLVIALAVTATCFAAFFGPAIGSYLPSLVQDEEQLGPANSAWSTLDNLAFIVGPGVAGLLIAAGGMVTAFVLNAISFGVIAVILWRLPPNVPASAGSPVEPATGAAAASAAGSAAAAPAATAAPTGGAAAAPAATAAPLVPRSVIVPVAGLALIDLVGSIAGGGLSVLTVIIATTTLGGGEAATGFLNAGLGVGGFVGALVAGALVLRPSLVPVLVGGSVVAAAGLAVLGYADVLALAIGAIAVFAAGSLVIEVSSATIFQRAVPDAIRGRALGLLGTSSTLAFAAGSFALPVLAEALGTGPVLAASAMGVAVAGIAGTVMAAPAARRPASAAASVRVARLAGLPLFAGVPGPTLEAMVARLVPVRVAAGEVVIREGDPPDRFYLVDEGTFDVTRAGPDGTEHLRTMGPQEVFGEIGLLRGVPRTASVTATTDGALLALDGADFLELVNAGQQLRPRLLDLHRGAPGAGY